MPLAALLFLLVQTPAELWRAGERAAAIDARVKELQGEPGRTEWRLELADWELGVHRYAAALEHLAPLGPEADGRRGLALFRLAEFERALPLLRADDAALVFYRLDALYALARLEEADGLLAATRARFGDSNPRLVLLEAQRLARLGQHARAIPLFRAVLEQDDLDAAARFGLGQALVRHGEREAGLAMLAEHRRLTPLLDQLDYARRGVDLAPSHGPTLAAFGDAWRAVGRIAAALAVYREASQLALPSDLAPIALRHARCLAEDRQDLAAALQVLAEAHGRTPDVRLAVRSGDLLLEAQRFSEAVLCFETALALRPSDAQVQERLALARRGVQKP